MSLATALRTWPARDLVAAITRMPDDSALVRAEAGDLSGWNETAANVADLYDLVHYYVRAEYARWTADPDELREEVAKRRRAGWRPPPEPLIPPVAHRPPSLAEQYRAAYLAAVERYATMNGNGDSGSEYETVNGLRLITSDEFDAALGI